MSAVTKSAVGNRVTFKDRHGKSVTGVALKFASDSMLVGVQSEARPYVRSGDKWVPNNALWVVPYADVLQAAA